MCGRATLTTSTEELSEVLDLVEAPKLDPRYNIAPTQPLAVMKARGRLELVPWNRMVNVMVERASVKPEFRCLVAFDGFYEWKKVTPKDKQPFLFRRQDHKPFFVGGILRADGSAAVVTTAAQDDMRSIHDRQPVVLGLDHAEWDAWLAGERRTGSLAGMEHYAVSKHVSNWRNDDPKCIEPLVQHEITLDPKV